MQQNRSKSLKAASVPATHIGSGAPSTLHMNEFSGSLRLVLQCSIKDGKTFFDEVNDELDFM